MFSLSICVLVSRALSFSRLHCLLQVVQQGKDILCVSQFTLFNIMKGNKPDFHLAMAPTPVRQLLQHACIHANLSTQ